jgi:hypothetical protein
MNMRRLTVAAALGALLAGRYHWRRIVHGGPRACGGLAPARWWPDGMRRTQVVSLFGECSGGERCATGRSREDVVT